MTVVAIVRCFTVAETRISVPLIATLAQSLPKHIAILGSGFTRAVMFGCFGRFQTPASMTAVKFQHDGELRGNWNIDRSERGSQDAIHGFNPHHAKLYRFCNGFRRFELFG